MARNWCDCRPEAGPSTLRKSAYSDGVSVSSTAHCSKSWRCTCFTRARILKHGASWSFFTCAIAAPSSWIMSFIHSSEVWCWMMKSISSWCDERGRCAASSAPSWR